MYERERTMSTTAMEHQGTDETVATMKAVVGARYGRPSVLELRGVEAPEPEERQVLVRVHASSVNPADWYAITGFLFARMGNGLRRPRVAAVGSDVAGRVEAVGAGVTAIRPGDAVFGTATGAWAELACAREDRLALKPPGVSFADAAALPIAGCTALQALRDHGRLEPGQRVLVNGAAGGVGTYAVQLAKALGAQVTAVCSARNVDLVRSLGADRVVDYTTEDFTRTGERHDLLLDVAGSRPLGALQRALSPGATVVVIGGPMTYRGLGPLPHLGATLVMSRLRRRTVRFFVAKIERDDLAYLASLLEAGTIRSVIERTYTLEHVADALAHLGERHARGKLVVTI
jgi:NADPH:quinone reductase-like Zn-dependent oxidoreductase